jgi:hypothetical protein
MSFHQNICRHDDIKMLINPSKCEDMDCSGSEYDPVVHSFEHANAPSDSIKEGSLVTSWETASFSTRPLFKEDTQYNRP